MSETWGYGCIAVFTILIIVSITLPRPAAAAALAQGDTQVLQEVEDLRALVSQLTGAEPVSHNDGFIPGSANTQRLIARQPDLWPQHFAFWSAVAADSSVSCSHVATDRPKEAGAAMHLVVGDDAGQLYFFTPSGHLLYEFDVGVPSPITALTSDLVRGNETHLLVGQQDGTITLLSVAHENPRVPDGSGIRAVHALMVSAAADRAQQLQEADGDTHQQAIRHLTFGSPGGRRTLLAVDNSGRVLLLTDRLGQVLMAQQVTHGPPLAVHLNSNFQFVMLTDTSASILLLKRGRTHVSRPCTGLGEDEAPSWAPGSDPHTPTGSPKDQSSSSSQPSAEATTAPGTRPTQQSGSGSHHAPVTASYTGPNRLVAAVFDPQRPFRVFGVTAAGELLVMTVPSGAAAHQCRVVQRVPLGVAPGPVQLVMGQGRLVLLHAAGVAAFNLSRHKTQLPGSLLVSHTWQQLWRLYGLSRQHQQMQPLLVASSSAGGKGAASDAGDSSSSGSSGSNGSSDSSSESSSSGGEQAILSSAWGSPLMAASASPAGLLLLPFGSRAVATFGVGTHRGAAGGGGGGLGSNAGLGAASGSSGSGGSSGGGGSDTNWYKLLQPFVIVMMIVVGTWQFLRASNSRNSLAAMRAARYGPGSMGGLGDMGAMGGPYMSGPAASFMMQGALDGQQGSAWGLGGPDEALGDFRSLDRDFGPYAGPRGNRQREQAGGGGLGALAARRRARAMMHNSRHAAGREQQQQQRGGAGGTAQFMSAGSRGEGAGVGSRQHGLQQGGAGRVAYQAAAAAGHDLLHDSIAEGTEEGEQEGAVGSPADAELMPRQQQQNEQLDEQQEDQQQEQQQQQVEQQEEQQQGL